MLKPFVLLLAISAGGMLGWQAGSPGGLVVSYLASVLGSSLGLWIGRKIQRNLDGD